MTDQKKPDRLIRVNSIVGKNGILPISKATFWASVKSGRFPKPIKLGPNITCFKLSEIEALVENGFNKEAE